MLLGLLTMITALTISAVAIYYSVAGLVAIFAAAALPIMIMGGTLEIAKLVTAVWLHRYWQQATWWLKTYLTTAVIILMFITSMGIFGFLSKAHIEQTAATGENVARIEQLETEIARQIAIVGRAENQIRQLESSGTGADANIQNQINLEQERIDRAFERIQPAIAQQNQIIADARAQDAIRTKPYEDQLTNIQAELVRLENSAKDYETQISSLAVDNSAVQPLLDQIASIENTITKVQGQIASGEREQVQQAQRTIGANADGSAGPRTRAAADAWIVEQRNRIETINTQISQLRKQSQGTVATERTRLTGIVNDIRTAQIPALKERELQMLSKIDEVRQTESPAIATARDEIQRLRRSAESQVAQSQALIERLRGQLAQTDKAADIDEQVQEQNTRIKEANAEIDKLTEQKYALQADYRKLEAEVGPIKYIAEFVYGEEANNNMLEEAVRWVIVTIIFVFDPLAVLLLIASQYTFEFNRKRKDDDGERLRQNEWREYEQRRAQAIVDNPGFTPSSDGNSVSNDEVRNTTEDEINENTTAEDTGTIQETDQTLSTTQEEESAEGRNEDNQTDTSEQEKYRIAEEYSSVEIVQEEPVEKKDTESSEELKQVRTQELEDQENDSSWSIAKRSWKEDHPDETLKEYKEKYISGEIDELPWEDYLDPKKKTYIMKQGNTQVKKTTE